MELEACNGNNDALNEIKKDLQNLRLVNDKLESLNEEKNKEIKLFKAKLEERCNGDLKIELNDTNKSKLSEVNDGIVDCVNNLQSIQEKITNLLT